MAQPALSNFNSVVRDSEIWKSRSSVIFCRWGNVFQRNHFHSGFMSTEELLQPVHEMWMEELSSEEDFTKVVRQLADGIVLRSQNVDSYSTIL